MKHVLSTTIALVFMSLPAATLWADDITAGLIRPAGDSNLSEFVWKNRVIMVFADSPQDPAFVRQIELLETRPDELTARDVVVLTDTDPDELSPVRKLSLIHI